MTERFLVIFFSCTTIGWAVYHFLMMRKMHRALETTKRMLAPKKYPVEDSINGHIHKQGPGGSGKIGAGGGGGGTYTVMAGGGGGSGGAGQVSVTYKTPTPSQGKVIRS